MKKVIKFSTPTGLYLGGGYYEIRATVHPIVFEDGMEKTRILHLDCV
jgi:hypothetical protein